MYVAPGGCARSTFRSPPVLGDFHYFFLNFPSETVYEKSCRQHRTPAGVQ